MVFTMLFYIIILWFLCINANDYSEEYKDTGAGAPTTGPDSIEELFVTVNSKGEVIPFHWNPADRNINDEKPIRRIPDKKVVGGKKSKPGAVPYIISLQLNGYQRCGGSIYNTKTILTAAHCFYNGGAKLSKHQLDSIIYVAGEFDNKQNEGTEQRRKAIDIQIHPEYHPKFSFYDIAIVTVDEPFEYNEFVQPIPIDKPPVVPEEVGTAMISGWGYTAKKDINGGEDPFYYPRALQQANVHVFTQQECYGFYGRHKEIKPYVDAGLICAGFESGRVDTCQGDSGGPLACYNPQKRNRRYLCGIVATGNFQGRKANFDVQQRNGMREFYGFLAPDFKGVGCGLPGFPGFY